jgi:hypothetical protein
VAGHPRCLGGGRAGRLHRWWRLWHQSHLAPSDLAAALGAQVADVSEPEPASEAR